MKRINPAVLNDDIIGVPGTGSYIFTTYSETLPSVHLSRGLRNMEFKLEKVLTVQECKVL
jgi:hypothetical protein